MTQITNMVTISVWLDPEVAQIQISFIQ